MQTQGTSGAGLGRVLPRVALGEQCSEGWRGSPQPEIVPSQLVLFTRLWYFNGIDSVDSRIDAISLASELDALRRASRMTTCRNEVDGRAGDSSTGPSNGRAAEDRAFLERAPMATGYAIGGDDSTGIDAGPSEQTASAMEMGVGTMATVPGKDARADVVVAVTGLGLE
ncbi:hypothetical protein VTK73DRAFT_6104 [Phialemonium thermophilum]|uniref:Uncharacterized protein n=1 Tax=Phialemonium thermophilum TaxID=223376 RepID=A0ABR3WKV3_9PEZI